MRLKYRKNIPINAATERELLRWHMEKVTKESSDENAAECASAMAELYRLFQNGYTFRFLAFAVLFQLIVYGGISVIQLMRGKR